MPLSYAQNLEDFHLSLAFAGQTHGFYIDVGAGHPVADNVTFWFYECGWRGIVVEPQPELARLYRHVRPRDQCVPCLLGRAAGEADFYRFERFHGLSTTVSSFADGAARLGESYSVVRVPRVTLAQLCEQHGVGEIDVLKIDVEGAEADVLAGNDWRRFRPKVVVAEAIMLEDGSPTWASWEPFLLDQGYTFALFDTLNRFYVASDQHEILERMPRSRAAWESATHMYEIGRAPESPHHPDHQLASELTQAFWALLPGLDADTLAMLLARARGTAPANMDALRAEVQTDKFRAILGRIACGYDGGQILEPEK
ncbi:MAG TPA: FkbM family methyltransferase [Hyphomicrobiaceae bacterium]|nr:FkbM family methyltransferase [Hyphomicrobiaceae bacterium]